jgi:hypothetical protein
MTIVGKGCIVKLGRVLIRAANRNMHGNTEENHEKSLYKYPAFGPRIEFGTLN